MHLADRGRLYRADDDAFIFVLPGATEEEVGGLYDAVRREISEYSRAQQRLGLTLSAGCAPVGHKMRKSM